MENIIYSVSDLNHEVNTLLMQHFNMICVTGEISNLSKPSSGHLYFSLKDENAHIRCALFRFQHSKTDFQLENGQQVIVTAQVALYEPRGDYQLIVKSVQLNGLGALQQLFNLSKQKLEKAGLFDEAHKKPLPHFPKKIGIITSPTGAALQDILKVLKHRFPVIPLSIYPVTVQGNTAANEIKLAIQQANTDAHCDVLILARGGGSLEDLWAFNEEPVAYAIFESRIPIITGIGHQTDFTIADFVADKRAPTPSAAAEMTTPDSKTVLMQLKEKEQRLIYLLHQQLQMQKTQLTHLQKRLKHPKEKIEQQAQQLDYLENRLFQATRYLHQEKKRLLPSTEQLEKILHDKIKYAHVFLSEKAATLDALSPLKVLQRGFSITHNARTQKTILTIEDVKAGDKITTTVSNGKIHSVVQYE